MKCKDCACCCKGFFEFKPEAYVCTGGPEPFVIDDINVECIEYPERIENITDSNKMVLTYLYEQEIKDIDNAIKTLEAIKQRSVRIGQSN